MKTMVWLLWVVVVCSLGTIRVSCMDRVSLRRRHRDIASRSKYLNILPELWIQQPLDHFQSSRNRTMWNQRYWMRRDLYTAGGPAFLLVAEETEAESSDMNSGLAWELYARHYGAVMFMLEHRFYGCSQPTGNLSLDSLQYLTIEQALADTASYISAMGKRYQLPEDTKWIVFGGSYAGNLATWLRYKYPHLVYAAVASSAPLLAKLDFSEYFEVIGASLSAHSDHCRVAVRDLVSELESLASSEQGQVVIQQRFRLSEPVNTNNTAVMADVFSEIAWDIAGVVFGGNKKLNSLCNYLAKSGLGSPLQRYFTWLRYQELADQQEELEMAKECPYRAWQYQMCTEFGFFQTSSTNVSLVGRHVPLDYYLEDCVKCFGPQFTQEFVEMAVSRTNTQYGGRSLKVSRVVFVNGSLDPWHSLGITKTILPDCPVIYIPGATHCQDMLPPRSTDSAALTEARLRVSASIGRWLHGDFAIFTEPPPLVPNSSQPEMSFAI